MLLKSEFEIGLFILGRCQDGDGRGVPHGRHGTVLRGAVGRHEEVVDGRRRSAVFRKIQRIPTQRFGQIVS